MNNKFMIQPTPIPIETCLTIDKAERDDKQFNRYWFDYPAEWLTSNNNEKVVGVRSIHLFYRRRKFEYYISVRKYLKSDFKASCKKILPSTEDKDKYDYDNAPPDIIDKAIVQMKTDLGTEYDKRVSEIANMRVITWQPTEDDLRHIYAILFTYLKKYMDDFNACIPSSLTLKPRFKMADYTNDVFVWDRDVQNDGKYIDDNSKFIYSIYSPRNTEALDPYYIDIKFGYMNQDFREVLNIRNDIQLPYNDEDPIDTDIDDGSQNYKSHLIKYSRRFDLKNVWDRHHCKVFSSIASQSNMNYLGHTDIHFNPIKYFIIKSTDTKFYIDFFSGKHPKAPVKLPKGEDFFIELQLEQARKMLYI